MIHRMLRSYRLATKFPACGFFDEIKSEKFPIHLKLVLILENSGV